MQIKNETINTVIVATIPVGAFEETHFCDTPQESKIVTTFEGDTSHPPPPPGKTKTS